MNKNQVNNEQTNNIKNNNKVCLVILDGIGYKKEKFGNAVLAANMTNYLKIQKLGITTLIKASGLEVGLNNESDNGNSEVGHNAIGSGQYIKQGLSLVNESINTQNIFKSKVYLKAIENVTQTDRNLHLLILLSDGRLHSDINHLYAFLKNISEKQELNSKIGTVFIHAFLDGRDVPPQSAIRYIQDLNNKIKVLNVNAVLADVAGRNVAGMDRYESNTKLLQTAFDLWVNCIGINAENDLNSKIEEIYKNNKGFTDENLPAFVLSKSGKIKQNDSVILLNYRGDRAIEMCEMFDNFKYVEDAKKAFKNVFFAGMLEYDADLKLPKNYLVEPPKITNTLSECLVKNGIKEYSVTETQKFGHLTYFFNGNKKGYLDSSLETWEEIESDKVIFNTKPEMKAKEIASKLVKAIESGKYQFLKTNLTNGDMVGHTGDFKATVLALKAVDKALGKILQACIKNNVSLVVTSDHGNAEEMLQENGKPRTSHTNNKVIFSVVSNKKLKLNEGNFGLTNIAAVICELLEIKPFKQFNKPIVSIIKKQQ